MPRISEFYGVVISMYFNDHAPAHFHAVYGDHEAIYGIESLRAIRGRLPNRANSLVLEWAARHRLELQANWGRARRGLALNRVKPLE